jgi:hypothetical protein
MKNVPIITYESKTGSWNGIRSFSKAKSVEKNWPWIAQNVAGL